MKLKRILFVIAVLASVAFCEAQTFDYPTRVVNGQEVYEYPVQKGEGLYRISVTFGVTQEELIKFNPELKNSGLKYGQVILVPVKKDAAPKEEAVSKEDIAAARKEDVKKEPQKLEKPFFDLPEKQPLLTKQLRPVKPKEEEVFFEEDTMFVVEADSTVASLDTLRLALLIPLQADAQTYDVKMERFLKFYEGILLALREEKRENWKFEVFVYDIGKTDFRLQRILEQPEMERMHAIIGPAYSEQIPLVGDFVKEHGIVCLLPFTNGVENLERNKYLLQYNPVVPEGMRVVQFKKEVDDNWHNFDELMRTYFGVQTPPQSRPRYDILGYDLTRYFIPAVLNAMKAETDEAWQQAFETEHDGLQSTLRFKRMGLGGFMNTPIRVVPKSTVVATTDNSINNED